MKKKIKVALTTLLWIIVVVLVTFVLFIRFGNTEISSSDKILIGYDEGSGEFQINQERQFQFNGIDGPYVFGNDVYLVNDRNILERSRLSADRRLNIKVNNEDRDEFTLWIWDDEEVTHHEYELPGKLIAISDIEGNFNAFTSFLISNGVMNKDYRWTFGKNSLVLAGDFVDRGNDVIQVLWLIYKLDNEARYAGGRVHFIIGNHEAMNVQGRLGYANGKYKRLCRELNKVYKLKDPYRLYLSENSVLGKWIRTKNAIEKIGPYLFVHAGLSIESVTYSIGQMNTSIRENLHQDLYGDPGEDKMANYLMGRTGPLWYRGLVKDYKYYDKIREDDLDRILTHFNVRSIVVGHNIVDDVSFDFGDKLIRLDVKHGAAKNSPYTKGLLIEKDHLYRLDATGGKKRLTGI